MGRSLDVYACYGVALGGGTNEPWRVVEVTEDGDLDPTRLAWLPDAEEREDDVETLLEGHLSQAVGGLDPEDGWERDGYHERYRAAKVKVGVSLGHPGVDEWNTVVLYATTSCRSQEYDALEMGDLTVDPAWDVALDVALAALGITPTRTRGWLAYANYS